MESALHAVPDQALDRLRDIHGITAVPWWPLAPGWWVLLGAAVVLGLAAWQWRTVLRLRLPIPGLTRGSWRWTAAAALRDLRRRARAGQDAKTTAGELSELLRRIAMARRGRPACAGLTGADWLAWLTTHDPQGFPWTDRGRVLLTAPYAPDSQAADADLFALIEAAFAWVSNPGPTAIKLVPTIRPGGAFAPPGTFSASAAGKAVGALNVRAGVTDPGPRWKRETNDDGDHPKAPPQGTPRV